MIYALLLGAWTVFLFIVVPLAVGWLIARRRPAYVTWIVLVALMAWSQSRDDDLSGIWIAVALLGGLGLPVVFVGTRLRAGEALRTMATRRERRV